MNLSINCTAPAAAGASAGRTGRPDLAALMKPVAEALGMSESELRAATRKGTSLNDLATAKGVSHEDLIAAIKKGLESARSAAGGTSTDEDLTAVAERIAARTPGTGRPAGAPPAGGPRPGGPPPMGGPRRAGGDGDGDADDTTSATSDDDDATASVFAALSATLDMTVAELLSSLASGTSLTDLASSKGVSASTVGSVASTGLQYDQRLERRCSPAAGRWYAARIPRTTVPGIRRPTHRRRDDVRPRARTHRSDAERRSTPPGGRPWRSG